MGLEIGTVKEWRGDKYAFIGGNPKEQKSWEKMRPFVSSAEKPSKGASDVALDAVDVIDKGIKVAADVNPAFNPMYQAVRKAGESVSPENAYKAGGAVTDFTGSPELGAAANFGIQALPSILSGTAVKSASESILKPAGRWVMRKAINPSKAANLSGDAAKATETFLKEGVNVTPGGIAKFGKEVRKLAGEVDDIVNAAEKSGAQVGKVDVLKPWVEKLKEVSKQINNKEDVAAVKAVLKEFMEDPRIKGSASIPIKMAQEMKSATYKALGRKSYGGELKSANVEGQKSIVSGLRSGIEKAAPGVAPLNKRMSELLNAIEVAEPRALSAGGTTMGGLSYLAENPFAGGAFMLDRSDLFKSLLGRFLYSGAPSVLGNTTRLGTALGMGATQNMREE